MEQVSLIDQQFPVVGRETQGITLGNAPLATIDPLAPDAAAELAKVNEFYPFLRVGSQLVIGSGGEEVTTFDLDGVIRHSLPGTDLGNAERAGEAEKGGLGGISGALDIFGGDGVQPAASSRLLGERLEIELLSPAAAGQEPSIRHIERDIVPTQAAPMDRAELANRLIWSDDLFADTGVVDAQVATWLSLEDMLANRDRLDAALRTGVGLPIDPAVVQHPRARPSVNGLALATAIAEQSSQLLETRFPDLRAYRDRTALFAFERQGIGQLTGTRSAYDIMAMPMRLVSRGPTQIADAAVLAVGVTATRLEQAILSSLLQPTPDWPDPHIHSASADLDAALATGATLQVRPADGAGAATSGRTIVALDSSGKTVSDIAWSLDASTNELVGRGADGRGITSVEQLILEGFSGYWLAILSTGACAMSIPSRFQHGAAAIGAALACVLVGVATPVGAFGGLRGHITAWIGVIIALIFGLASQP